MDISVIVPIYGVEKYIEKCLRSLFEQTKTDGVEFILVNDCTKDNSMAIARNVISEYPDLTIRILEHPENRGIAATRQTGIDAATGDYTIQIDSDDWCEPTMLEELYDNAIQNDADIVACDFFDCDDKVHKNIHSHNKFESVERLMLAANMFSPSIWSRLIRRNLYIDNGLKCDNGISSGEDAVLMPMFYYVANKVVYHPKAYLHYTYNPQSMTRKNNFNVFLDHLKIPYVWESFFRKTTDYSRLKSTINNYKHLRKYRILRLSKGREQREYNRMFPISNRSIFCNNRLALSVKATLFLANIGLLPISNLVCRFGKKLYKHNQ